MTRLCTSEKDLAELAVSCGRAARVAIDAEANGMFAYRPQLCVLQLAWHDQGKLELAIVDPLALDLTPLAALLGAAGPVKVLHDLTFDVRLLATRGIAVGNVRDTSVAARFLGEQATGLSSLVRNRFAVELEKALQEHDWSKRPLDERQLGYLADDVRYLLDLEDALLAEVAARGIADEVAVECDYKLACAHGPPRDERPPHARIKGHARLDPIGRSVLRRLCEIREQLAEQRDVPPFRIARSSLLLDLARRRPGSEQAVRRACGRDRAAARFAGEWQRAVSLGLQDGGEPRETQPPPPEDLPARKSFERRLTSWRRDRAAERGVDPQVIIPGHCFDQLAAAVIAHRGCYDSLCDALASIAGFGSCRIGRYAESLAKLTSIDESPAVLAPAVG